MLVLGEGVLMPASNCISTAVCQHCICSVHVWLGLNSVYLCWAHNSGAVELFWCVACHASAVQIGRQRMPPGSEGCQLGSSQMQHAVAVEALTSLNSKPLLVLASACTNLVRGDCHK